MDDAKGDATTFLKDWINWTQEKIVVGGGREDLNILSHSLLSFLGHVPDPKQLNSKDLLASLTSFVKVLELVLEPSKKLKVQRQQKQIRRLTRKVLTGSSYIFSAIFSVVTKQSAPNPVIINILTEVAKPNPQIWEKAKDKFFAYYTSTILDSRVPPPESTFSAYRPFLASLNEADLENKLIPAQVAQLKRLPGLGLLTLNNVLQCSTVDMSKFLNKDFFPVLKEHIQTKDDEIRKNLVPVLRALAEHTKDAEAIQQFGTEILKSPSGSLPAQRSTWSSSLQSVALSPATDGLKAISSQVITQLIPFIKKETNVDAFQVHLQTLGSWLCFSSTFPVDAVKLYEEPLLDDKKFDKVKAHLFSLNTVLSKTQVDPKTDFNSLTKGLIQVISKVKQRPTNRMEGLLAFQIALILAQQFPALATQFDKEGIWAYLFSPNSFLLSEDFCERLDVNGQPVLYDFIKTFLSGRFKSDLLSKSPPFFDFLISLMNFGKWRESRHNTLKMVDEAHVNFPTLSIQLFDSFKKSLSAANKPAPTCLSQTFEALLSNQLPQSFFPSLVLYAHHPLVAGSANTFRRCCRKLKLNVENIVKEDLQSLQSFLFGSEALLNHDPLVQEAAARGISGLVSQLKDSALAEGFLAPLIDLIDENKWLSLPKNELGIFTTPEGQIWKQDGKVSGPRTVVVQSAEEKWAAEMRAAKLAQQGKEDPVLKAQREAQLKEESVIRNKVKLVFNSIAFIFDTFVNVSKSSPKLLEESIYLLTPKLVKLLPNPGFSAKASSCILALSQNCLKSELGRRSGGVVVLGFNKSLTDKHREEVFASLLEEAAAASDKKLFTQTQFAVFYPIVQNVMTTNHPPGSQHIALGLIEKHAETVHPPTIIETLSYVISNVKRYQQRATQALLKATEKMEGGVSSVTLDVTLEQLASPQLAMRTAAIDSLALVKGLAESNSQKLVYYLFLASHDSDPAVVEKAQKLFASLNSQIGDQFYAQYEPLFSVDSDDTRQAVGRAIAAALVQFPALLTETQQKLMALWVAKVPTKDQLTYEPEVVANCHRFQLMALKILQQISALPHTEANVSDLFAFLVQHSLLTKNKDVQKEASKLGLVASTSFVKEPKHLKSLIVLFEKFLDDEKTNPLVLEGVVQYTGVVVLALPADDKQAHTLVEKIVTVCVRGTHEVRLVGASVLAKAIPSMKEKGKDLLVMTCQQTIGVNTKAGERRGYAFAFAGIAKGVGMSNALNNQGTLADIVKALEAKQPTDGSRLGALCAVESLAMIGQRLFEPSLIKVIGPFMNCFSDKDKKILDTTKRAAKTLMLGLSGGGLKIVLPAISAAVLDRQWQKKVGAIEILGLMANCQPKQLSSCLPQIVPQLTQVLNDSHIKVQEAGRRALQLIGEVITNPEIQQHVPLLLAALDDPNQNTENMLEALIQTKFVHHIDSPSLSLIMPVLKRALVDRNTATKTKATKIVGNMSQLTAHKDLKPYLEGVMDAVQRVLLDPIPSTRATAAKAVGGLVYGMGEEEFPNLIFWLLDNIQNGTGFIERNGAAQGLADVIAHLPEHRFKLDLLPYILKMTDSEKPTTREGFISVFQFLPESWGSTFATYLEKALPAVTKRLSDETEIVREAAIKAGQAIVNAYSETATDLLIPTLEQGIFDENWRIRQSSIQLLGEFLTKISKTNNVATEEVDLTGVINVDRGTNILATLYLVRKDSNMFVQQMASTTWKAVVDNTPKTLKAILPTLMKIILESLKTQAEKRTIAKLTLGDLVNKLGERVLPDIIPPLQRGLDSLDPIEREGVTLGLTELMSCSTKNQILDFLGQLIPAVHKALCDSSHEVQEAAAQAFDILYSHVGNRAIDEIVPALIKQLEDEDATVSQKALNGLKQMLAVRSSVVLPFVIPKLSAPPMTLFNAKALASLAEVSGEGLYSHLPTIIPAILQGVYPPGQFENPHEELLAAVKRVANATGQEGVATLVEELIGLCKSPVLTHQHLHLGAITVLGEFVETTETDLTEEINAMVGVCLDLLDSSRVEIQTATLKTLAIVTSKIPKTDLSFIGGINASLDVIQRNVHFQSLRGGKGVLAGFCLPGGLQGILPMYLEGLRTPVPSQRVSLLEGIRSIISLTSPEGLENDKNVVHIIGPCIRLFTTKTETLVKVNLILTLNDLIDKAKQKIKTAVPQLQTIYVKAIADTEKEVRDVASPGLCKLIAFARIDFILNELIRLFNSSTGSSVVSILSTIKSLLSDPANPKPKPEVINTLTERLFEYLNDSDESIKATASQCFGPLSQTLTSEGLEKMVVKLMSQPGHNGSILALNSIVSAKSTIFETVQDKFETFLTTSVKSDKIIVRQSVARVIGAYVLILEGETLEQWVLVLNSLTEDTAVDVRVTALHTLKNVAKSKHEVVFPYLNVILPTIWPRVKDKKVVRANFAAERAVFHLLQAQANAGQPILKAIQKQLEPALLKELVEYSKNVLSKAQESEEEVEN